MSDVAAVANVSMKTVSRVLNNEAHVRPALRDRVLAAVTELGYKPHFAARQLAANRSFLFAMLVRDHSVTYNSGIIAAASVECRKHGYHLISESCTPDESACDTVRRICARLNPDGLILAPPLSNDTNLLRAAEEIGVPIARLAGVGVGYGVAIRVQELEVSLQLMRHLLDLGHRRIGFITPPAGAGAAKERQVAYERALASAGLPADPTLIVPGEFDFVSGALGARGLFALADRPTAIFAANDAMALGAIAAARDAGLRVPDDVAIAGFDDSPASRMCYPALTTVRQPMSGMARAAVLALLGCEVSAEPLEHVLLPRGSTTGRDRLLFSSRDA
jgi:LacI family transcriptional regulator